MRGWGNRSKPLLSWTRLTWDPPRFEQVRWRHAVKYSRPSRSPDVAPSSRIKPDGFRPHQAKSVQNVLVLRGPQRNRALFDEECHSLINEALESFDTILVNFPEDEAPSLSALEKYRSAFEASLTQPRYRRNSAANDIYAALREVFARNGRGALNQKILTEFEDYVRNQMISPEAAKLHRDLADMRHPSEWYPKSRELQRSIHLHVGPTNSGKTYHALRKLEQAGTGVYMGPLRLLAHEVYKRLSAKGLSCSLITGDDIRVPPHGEEARILSCTVEMAPISSPTIRDVAVIDEIQMMADDQRGWAWTSAFMGLVAREIHLCGEPRVVPLIREMADLMGESLQIHEYERLSPLKVESKSLGGKLQKLRKGDCVVSFSRNQLHTLKAEIEKLTNKRCAIVYGGLPPETRNLQAELFNDPDNDYDFLVASDAVGMGLNLTIKRIIFETTLKYSREFFARISAAQVKQIAGRAGRYRTAAQDMQAASANVSSAVSPSSSLESRSPELSPLSENVGLVTTLYDLDLPYIREAMNAELSPLMSAGIQPPPEIVKRFAAYFSRSTPFRFILKRLAECASTRSRNFVTWNPSQYALADIIEDIEGLNLTDRYVITLCPANLRIGTGEISNVMRALARCVASQSGGGFLDIPELELEILDQPLSQSREYLGQLETLHSAIGLYCWLSYRFQGVFPNQAMAMYTRRLVEKQIAKYLHEAASDQKQRERKLAWLQTRRQQMVDQLMKEKPKDGEVNADLATESNTKSDERSETGDVDDSRPNADNEMGLSSEESDVEYGVTGTEKDMESSNSLDLSNDATPASDLERNAGKTQFALENIDVGRHPENKPTSSTSV